MLARNSQRYAYSLMASGHAPSQMNPGPQGCQLSPIQARQFGTSYFGKLSTPLQKLKFINHPRYGWVYPVLSMDRKREWPNLARFGLLSSTLLNSLILYSTFVMPIFTAEASAIFAHPLFLLPSLAYNVRLYSKHYALFYGDKSLITAMWLKKDGKTTIVEYRSGESRQVTNTDIYWKKVINNRFETRTEFCHGSNIYS